MFIGDERTVDSAIAQSLMTHSHFAGDMAHSQPANMLTVHDAHLRSRPKKTVTPGLSHKKKKRRKSNVLPFGENLLIHQLVFSKSEELFPFATVILLYDFLSFLFIFLRDSRVEACVLAARQTLFPQLQK